MASVNETRPTDLKLYEFPARFDTKLTQVFEQELDRLRSKDGDIARIKFPHGKYPSGNSEGWIALSYEAVKFVFTDPRLGIAGHYLHDYPRVLANPGARPPAPMGFAAMDGPDHIRLRRILARHLSAKQTELLRQRVEGILEGILDDFVIHGQGADMLAHYADHVPITVVCELLGVPREERHRFGPAGKELTSGRMSDEQEASSQITTINEYFSELVAERREVPGDDLLSTFIHDAEAGHMSDEDLAGLGFSVLFAGHDAPTVTLANMLQVLAHSPKLYKMLHEQPELVPSTVDEFLRISPAAAVLRPRIALEDIEAFGVTIKKDEVVQPQLQAANRDPAMFADPQTVDITREDNPHIRFGFGSHACVGSLVARMELTVALKQVLARFQSLSSAETDGEDADWRAGAYLRGPHSIRVNWTLADS